MTFVSEIERKKKLILAYVETSLDEMVRQHQYAHEDGQGMNIHTFRIELKADGQVGPDNKGIVIHCNNELSIGCKVIK